MISGTKAESGGLGGTCLSVRSLDSELWDLQPRAWYCSANMRLAPQPFRGGNETEIFQKTVNRLELIKQKPLARGEAAQMWVAPLPPVYPHQADCLSSSVRTIVIGPVIIIRLKPHPLQSLMSRPGADPLLCFSPLNHSLAACRLKSAALPFWFYYSREAPRVLQPLCG